ncbi:MAG: GntR family transcriptional regulator [Pseudomonadales bacterium]|jgi:DNA-binding FadR family transcriptional regulator|nr:GntR family transcriptional regulator [Pseudomonadales bacterium]MDP7357019.1 GntR family transcriptional regulator [Pseudomonadales bacterium]MDP7596073.1 GntR family transcriptional regulator [Pseudomonadales bacterium]HJN50562.1 GntR family transcriptional regulator [Pseudomonadales bacterium]|tara:strand:- start:63 stop:797 length:735 start_codon:yes stop_codon:yes gene_type:complete
MTINNVSRAAEITGVLRDEILRGQYRSGERLPSERDLAARFLANRGAVREALKKLEQLGIAAIHPGGVRVVPIEDSTLEVLGHILDLEELPNAVLVDQLFTVIGALIAMSARTAIETADDSQLDAARDIVARIRAAKDAVSRQASWHELGDYFNQINKNLVLRLIGNGLKTQFMGRMEGIGVEVQLDDATTLKIVNELDAAIAARDAGGVASAAQQHFNLVREKFLEALQSLADTSTHKVGNNP